MKELISSGDWPLKQQQQRSDQHTQPQQLLAALGVEPLRLLSPVWVFCCCRDKRVYAPQFHPLFEVTASLAQSRPPLVKRVQRASLGDQRQARNHITAPRAADDHDSVFVPMRVLLLGCTNRKRRVTERRCCSIWESLENDDNFGSYTETVAAGSAVAVNDRTLLHFCVEALGGRVISFGDVKNALNSFSSAPSLALDVSHPVDLVIVSDVHAVRKHGSYSAVDFAPPLVRDFTKRSKTAETSILQELHETNVPCLRLQWLFETYRLVRLPRNIYPQLWHSWDAHLMRNIETFGQLASPALQTPECP